MRVHETKRRSLIKAISFRIVEIAVDTIILNLFVAPAIALALAITLEAICFGLHFLFERVWNKISYGRYIKET